MSESLEPTDLLDEDGKVDADKIRSRAMSNKPSRRHVDDETCSRWRRELDGEPNAEAVACDTKYNAKTVGKHARGDCTCDADAPELEYARNYETRGGGVWRVADE